MTVALGALAMLATVAVTGCGEAATDTGSSPYGWSTASEAPTGSAEPEPAEPAGLIESPEATATPIDISGPLVIPESDPALWPPGPLSELTPEEWESTIAMWGPYAECAPFSLFIDYHEGRLSPEEYTAYAMYSFAPASLWFTADPADLVLPERYSLSDEEESLQVLGFAVEIFIDDIDPAFRDQLWLRLVGETYAEANRPLTDEEIEEALAPFEEEDGLP